MHTASKQVIPKSAVSTTTIRGKAARYPRQHDARVQTLWTYTALHCRKEENIQRHHDICHHAYELLIPPATRCKGWDCGRSLAGTAGSNPAGAWMSVCCDCCVLSGRGRLQLKCDGTRWSREGKWRGNWRIEWVESTLHTTSEHGVSSSRLNWRPRRINGLVRFVERRNMVSARVPSHFNRHLSATGRSLVQSSPTDYEASVWYRNLNNEQALAH